MASNEKPDAALPEYIQDAMQRLGGATGLALFWGGTVRVDAHDVRAVCNHLTAQAEALVNWKSLVQHKCGVVSGLAKMYRESRAENATQAEQIARIRNIVDAQDSTEDTATLVEREIKALCDMVDARDKKIERLVDVGTRALANYVQQMPAFLHELDAVLKEANHD